MLYYPVQNRLWTAGIQDILIGLGQQRRRLSAADAQRERLRLKQLKASPIRKAKEGMRTSLRCEPFAAEENS